MTKLSNYLTDDEWDALFYLMYGPLSEEAEMNVGNCMEIGIQKMMELGYVFEHLDDEGKPNEEKGETKSINWMKLTIFDGNPHHLDPLVHIAGGREYLQEHVPSLLHDTDDEFAAHLEAARAKIAELLEKHREDMRRVKAGLIQIPIPESVVGRELENQRIYRNGVLCGLIAEVDGDTVWATMDQDLFLQAGEGDLQFGLVTATN